MTPPAGSAPRLLTIGQLAAYAGVTIKAVRHYHARGLLTEPPRDASGYRRYGAEHAIALVKIRTLAEAGVPLARIAELLDADPSQFTAAIAEIDRGLQERIAALQRARERVAQLSGGDRLFVSPEAADFLDELRALGVSRRGVELERDGWILLQSAAPAEAAALLAAKRAALADAEFRALYLACDAAFEWAPDDPRLAPLAERVSRWLADHGGTRSPKRDQTAAMARLIATADGASSPAWERLGALARRDAARG